MYYLFEKSLLSNTTYFYFLGTLEADLLGGTAGLSLYRMISKTNGTEMIIAYQKTRSFISLTVGLFFKIIPGAAAPKVIDT
jgi:hypothetical protein